MLNPMANISDSNTQNMSTTNHIGNNSENMYADFGPPGVAERINDYLVMYYTPVLVCLGCIGNILSVCVFFRTKLRKLSSSYYLSALAVSDTIFLLALIIVWMNFLEIRISNEPGICQLVVYASGASSCLSVWSVVAFTVERFVAVLYPLRRQAVCTVARARAVLAGLVVLALLHSAPLLLFSEPRFKPHLNDTICDVAETYREAASIFNTLDTVVAFLVPLTIIVVLNSCTACAVWRLANIRRSMTVTSRGGRLCQDRDFVQGIPFPGTTQVCKMRRKRPIANSSSSQMKVTKMLLIVSTVFVCLNLPSYVMRLRAFIESSEPTSRTTIIVQYYCSIFFNTNFGINFALYCVSGQNFRRAVVAMLCPGKRFSWCRGGRNGLDVEADGRTQEGGTQVTVSEFVRSSGSCGSRRRTTVTRNGSWRDCHEMRPLE